MKNMLKICIEEITVFSKDELENKINLLQIKHPLWKFHQIVSLSRHCFYIVFIGDALEY
ncbi:MAG: hypothetical protein WC934_06140 [Acidithiobacillus sp.]|jgi:hypothetical protein